MDKTQKLDDKRQVFVCEVCGNETLPTRKLEVIAFMENIYHISEWRVCPIRKGEKGCRHWQLFNYEISQEEFISRQQVVLTPDEKEKK